MFSRVVKTTHCRAATITQGYDVVKAEGYRIKGKRVIAVNPRTAYAREPVKVPTLLECIRVLNGRRKDKFTLIVEHDAFENPYLLNEWSAFEATARRDSPQLGEILCLTSGEKFRRFLDNCPRIAYIHTGEGCDPDIISGLSSHRDVLVVLTNNRVAKFAALGAGISSEDL